MGEKDRRPGPDLEDPDPNGWRADLDEMLGRPELVPRPQRPLGLAVAIPPPNARVHVQSADHAGVPHSKSVCYPAAFNLMPSNLGSTLRSISAVPLRFGGSVRTAA